MPKPQMKNYTLKHPFPEELQLTEQSKKLFEEGAPGQGYIGVLDMETGEVHLLPSFNKEDGKERLNKHGEKFKHYLESQQPLGTMTGDLHTFATGKLGLGQKGGARGKLMGFGIWKDEEGNIAEFRNRSSSQNLFSIKYDPLYREYYNDSVSHHSAHSLALPREIPREICQEIFNCLTDGLELPREDVSTSPRVHGEIRHHFSVENNYWGNFSEDYDAGEETASIMLGFNYLEELITHNRISTIEMLMEKSPCVISGRHPDCRFGGPDVEVKTGLTIAIENKKYDVANLFLKQGATWQNDPQVNKKIISLLKEQITADPENAQEAKALLNRVQGKNSMHILRFLESPIGTKLFDLANESNINLVKELQKSFDFGDVCVADLKEHIKSPQFQAKLTQNTGYLSIFSATDKGKKEKMDNIIANLDSPKPEIASDKFRQLKGDLIALKEGADAEQQKGIQYK